MKTELIKLTNTDTAHNVWSELEPHSDCSVFQSWSWIGPWLERVIQTRNPWMVVAHENSRPMGLAIAIERYWIRNYLFPVKVLFINEAGPNDLDFCIEYNGFLLRSGREREARDAMLNALTHSPLDWDELHIRRISETSTNGFLFDDNGLPGGLRIRVTSPLICRYVDLTELRANQMSFTDSLSTRRRKKIRREIRIAEKAGPLRVESARTVHDALSTFDELKIYHQLRWERSGEPGSFADPDWEGFHREIITREFPRNGVQLLKVLAGDVPIGWIYSLVRDGYVYVIQTGFNYDSIPHLRPGETTHFMAIQWNYEQGFDRYDFLGGDSFYKQTLSNSSSRLVYLTVQRHKSKLMLENYFRSIGRSAKRLKGLLNLGP